MCLGVPGKLIEVGSQSGLRTGRIDFGGVRKEVCLELTPDASIGDFVLVHVGFALQVIDEDEARAVFKFLEQMDDLQMDDLDELGKETPPDATAIQAGETASSGTDEIMDSP